MRQLSCIVLTGLLFLIADVGTGQDKRVELKAKGWGSVSGTVTLVGPVPNLPPIPILPGGMVPNKLWVVDPKTKAVANVIVWVKPPKDTFFPIHQKYSRRKDDLVIETKGLLFEPRISACNPSYF